MRSTFASAVIAALGSTFLAPLASADHYDAAYLGLRGSYVISDTGATIGSGNFDYQEDYAEGFAAQGYLGWVLDGNFRLELEAGYRSADLDDVTIVRDGSATYTVGSAVDVGGDAQAGTVMMNLFLDIHLFKDTNILPWIGAGFGGAYVDYEIDDPSALFSAQDQTWVLAYQFMTGVTFPVGEGISMSLGYRYFQTQDFTYQTIAGDEQETDLTQHAVDLGLQFHL